MRTTVAAIFALLLTCQPARPAAELLNGISVIVNNQVITEQQIARGIHEAVRDAYGLYGGQPQVLEQRIRQFRADHVERLVQRELILAEFKALGYQLPETYIDDHIQSQIKEIYGDRVTLTRDLQAQGRTYEQFSREQRDLLIESLLRARNVSADKIIISPARIESHYQANLQEYKLGDQVKLRMISINQPIGAPAGMAKRVADEVYAKIVEGAPFSQMAAVYSDGSARLSGGDRGWIGRDFLKEELTEVAFSLRPGEMSRVIDLPEAAYILYVEDARINYTRSLADVSEEIERELRNQERARLLKKWIDRLKAKNFVRYF